jgi:hypothetical protein
MAVNHLLALVEKDGFAQEREEGARLATRRWTALSGNLIVRKPYLAGTFAARLGLQQAGSSVACCPLPSIVGG